MPKFTFTLPKKMTKKGVQTVGGKYNFEDGKLTVEEAIARKIKKVLTTYYGCTVSQETEAEPTDPATDGGTEGGQDPVLSKTTTKAGAK